MKYKSSLKQFSFTSLLLILLSVAGCKEKTPVYAPEYGAASSAKKTLLFGVPTQPYYDLALPMVNYLNKHLKGAEIRVVATYTLEDYIKRLNSGNFDLTIVNGEISLASEKHGYTIVGKVKNDEDYRGAILVNRDSLIRTVQDLRGKTIATSGRLALAGHRMPMLFLYNNGLKDANDLHFLTSNSFESVIMNVYLGNCSAGFSWMVNWKAFLATRPEIASKVMVKWVTPQMVNTSVVFRNAIDQETQTQLKSALFSMHTNEEGKAALDRLKMAGFEPANSDTYKPIKQFISDYNAAFGTNRQ